MMADQNIGQYVHERVGNKLFDIRQGFEDEVYSKLTESEKEVFKTALQQIENKVIFIQEMMSFTEDLQRNSYIYKKVEELEVLVDEMHKAITFMLLKYKGTTTPEPRLTNNGGGWDSFRTKI